jgi:hypothetical protein
MDNLNFYLNHCFICDNSGSFDLSNVQKSCVERCKRNAKKEWVERISTSISRNAKADFELYLLACMAKNDNQFTRLLEPLFIAFEPTLSQILSISHSVCVDCCDLYTPCHISEWIDTNPELFEYEINFFSYIIETFSGYITIDLVPFSDQDTRVKPIRKTSTLSEHDKLRQLYTIVHRYSN